MGFICDFLPSLCHCLLQVVDFLDHFCLHLTEVFIILLLGGFNLQQGVSVLLLHYLEALLQMHDLVHVEVLCHGVVMLGKPFVIKLDYLLSISSLLEALENVVFVA